MQACNKPGGGRGAIFAADDVADASGVEVVKGEDESFWSDLAWIPCSDEEEARQPRLPHDPGRPTKEEVRRHMVHHWPYRAWCRHCVRGRAVSSQHRTKTDEEKECGRSRIPTISFDHCFLGTASDGESAHVNPFCFRTTCAPGNARSTGVRLSSAFQELQKLRSALKSSVRNERPEQQVVVDPRVSLVASDIDCSITLSDDGSPRTPILRRNCRASPPRGSGTGRGRKYRGCIRHNSR